VHREVNPIIAIMQKLFDVTQYRGIPSGCHYSMIYDPMIQSMIQ